MRNVILDKECSVGNYTYIGEYTSITKTTIGNFCSIASNVRIGHGEHNLETFSTNSLFFKKSYLTQKSCVIKNDVWIGTEAVISRGVTIGNGAVIGANSFVNKDIPDYAIVVGSPAKILRYRFDTTTRKKLLATEWWNFKDLEEIKTIFKSINNDEI